MPWMGWERDGDQQRHPSRAGFGALYQVPGSQNKAITPDARLCDLMSRKGLAYLSMACEPPGSAGAYGAGKAFLECKILRAP